MSIYAISIFGMCMSLPIIMVIYKFSTIKEVKQIFLSEMTLSLGISTKRHEG
jgi:hypothetical protein